MTYHPHPQVTHTVEEAQFIEAQRISKGMRAAALAAQLAEADRVEAEVEELHLRMLTLKADRLGRKLKKTTTGAYVLTNWTYSKHFSELVDVAAEIKKLEGAT